MNFYFNNGINYIKHYERKLKRNVKRDVKKTIRINAQAEINIISSSVCIRKRVLSLVCIILCYHFPYLYYRSYKKKNPLPIVVLIPLGFIFAYQYDMFYGDKMRRIKIEAERLIEEKPQLFYFPRNANIVSQDEYESILQIQKKPN